MPDGIWRARRRAERDRALARPTSSPSRARARRVTLGDGAREAMERSAAVVADARRRRRAGLRRLDRLRLARQRDDPRRAPRGAAARAGALARGRHGPAGRARGRAGDDAAARAHAGDGLLGRAARGRRDDRSRCSTPGSRRSCPSTARSARSGDLAPLAHCALVLIGEGEVRRRRRAAADALRGRHRAARRSSAKEGLALINGTDGMLGMLLLAAARPARGCCGSPTSPPRCRSRRCSAPTARSPRTWSRCARSRARRRAPRTCARCSPARRSSPATATATTACRTPTRCAARRRSPAPRATRSTHAERVAAAELRVGDRQPDGAARRPRRVVRQLPRRAARVRVRLPRDRGRRGRRDRRAPHRPAARRDAARTGCRRSSPPTPGVNSGLMIAQYTQAAMVAENRRLAAPASVDSLPTSAMQEDHVSMGWGAARKLRIARREPRADPRRRAASAPAHGLDLRAPLAPGAGTGAALRGAARRASPGRGRTAGSRPTWRRPRSWSRRARCSAPSRPTIGALA